MNSNKFKHLTAENRNDIQACLDRGMDFKETGKFIGKDPSTVSKEIKRHITIRPTRTVRRSEDGAAMAPPPCTLLLKPPYVCNSCLKRTRDCGHDKHLYLAGKAQEAYRETLVGSREGVMLNRQEFYDMDSIICEGVKKGQHIYHIVKSGGTNYSVSSVYRLLDRGYLSVSPVQLPRKVKFRPRKQPRAEYVPKACKAGRTYEDFTEYIGQNGITDWVEMDTVIGRPGGKVIITFDFTFCNFMFGLLSDDKTSLGVSGRISGLKELLRKNGFSFGEVFPLIVTDNGGEFSNVAAVENNENGEKECSLFFCDPMMSSQKPHVEKNHTLFRDIVPKGTSFDGFTQDDVNVIFSNVNSVRRKMFNGKSPYDFFEFAFGAELAGCVGIHRVADGDVVQSPLLLEQLGHK